MRFYKVHCMQCDQYQELFTNALSQETCAYCHAQGSLTSEDKRELEFKIECLERRIEEEQAEESTNWINTNNEMRRLRKMRFTIVK